jgi:Family of unknown function (DUF6353)
MKLPSSLSRMIGSVEFVAKKNAPAILTGAGVVGFAATTYLVGRAVLRSQPVIGNLKNDARKIMSRETDDIYTQQDRTKEMGELYLRQGFELLKIYSPAIVVGGLTLASFLGAHGIMLRRQATLLAAYTALDTSYKAYRGRVQAEIGEEREQLIYRGLRKVDSVNEGGEACQIDEWDDDPKQASPYSRFFDETSKNWSKTPEYNLFFLKTQQDYANHRLRARGYLFLNEVLEDLGLPTCQVGQLVGWKAEPGKHGDGFVDFGIFDPHDECNRAFVNGTEHTVLLDFNVDGFITIDE